MDKREKIESIIIGESLSLVNQQQGAMDDRHLPRIIADKVLKLFPEWISVGTETPEGDGRCVVRWANGSISDAPKEYVRSCRDSGLELFWLKGIKVNEIEHT